MNKCAHILTHFVIILRHQFFHAMYNFQKKFEIDWSVMRHYWSHSSSNSEIFIYSSLHHSKVWRKFFHSENLPGNVGSAICGSFNEDDFVSSRNVESVLWSHAGLSLFTKLLIASWSPQLRCRCPWQRGIHLEWSKIASFYPQSLLQEWSYHGGVESPSKAPLNQPDVILFFEALWRLPLEASYN